MTTATLFGLLRGVEDFPLACDDISRFLAMRRRRAASTPESLLGLWIDRRWIDCMPSGLSWLESTGEHRTARIRETAGVNGIWTLCWLEVSPAEPGLSRHELLVSLAAAYGSAAAASPPAFVPVFPLDTPASEVRGEWERVTKACVGRVLAPLYQDAHSGRLLTGARSESMRMNLAGRLGRDPALPPGQ